MAAPMRRDELLVEIQAFSLVLSHLQHKWDTLGVEMVRLSDEVERLKDENGYLKNDNERLRDELMELGERQ